MPRRLRKQRGSIVVVLLAVLVLFATYAMFQSLNIAAVRVERDRVTNESLAKAKEALVAYAVSDANRPGELPCPDIDDDGAATPGVDYVGSACASLIGRLPWKTLDLPDLRDDSGERLWYAVSDDFHASGAVALNSDTAFRTGNTSLTLTGQQAGTNLVALVFAPGAPVVRDGAATLQDRSGAGAVNAANYLDVASGQDNADANRVFAAADKSQSFNDRILPLHSDDIMSLVQRRAAREYAQHLRDHYDAWKNAAPPAGTTFTNFKGFYPWAAPLNDPTIKQPGVNDTTNGQLPLSSASVLWNAPGGVLAVCSGANTTQIQCTGLFIGALVIITGSVSNIGTAFVDPPTAANVTVSGIAIGPQTTWTLNTTVTPPRLDFTWRATILSLATITVRAPTASAWTTSSTWLDDNHWYEYAFYAVSPGYAVKGTGSCTPGGTPECVTVSNTTPPNNDKQAVVVMTGRALSPSATSPFCTTAPMPCIQTTRPVPAPIVPIATPQRQFLEGANVSAAPGGLVFEQNLRTATFNDMPIVVRP
jgi:hypothetical protein